MDNNPILYALPTMAGNEDIDATPLVAVSNEKPKPPVPAPGHKEEGPFSGYGNIHESLRIRAREIRLHINDYVNATLESDLIYQSMVSAEEQLQRAIYEMDLRGLV